MRVAQRGSFERLLRKIWHETEEHETCFGPSKQQSCQRLGSLSETSWAFAARGSPCIDSNPSALVSREGAVAESQREFAPSSRRKQAQGTTRLGGRECQMPALSLVELKI